MENLEDGYLDLKLNQCISNFRNRYKDEYICIKEFNIFLYEVQCEIGKKGVSQQNAFIVASLTELQKIFCSCILLCERGLPESANILVRTILELSFKIIEVVRNKEFVEDLLLAESFEKLVIVNEIEKSRLFDLVPPQKLNELRKKN